MAGYSVGYRLLLSASAPLAEMNGSVRKSVMRMSQPGATLSLCICANQGLMNHGAKSQQLVLKNKMYDRQNLEKLSSLFLGFDIVQVKNTEL